MDDQQRKIEAGAGLQESRLNEDFIDLLKKYGTTVLLILLAIMATYVGIQRYSQYQQDKTDQAFADLEGAANTPAILLKVAATWDGRGSVWEIATLRAAGAYIESARTRAEVGIDASQVEEFEPLTDEQVRANLQEAVKLYTSVLDRTKGSKPIFAQDARWGLATANLGLAALSEGDEREQYLNAAASETQAMIGIAEGNDPNKVAVGNARLELIELLRTSPVAIYETASLPESAQYKPDPRDDISNLIRDQMNPAQGPQQPEMRRLSPEEVQEIQERMNTDDPVFSIDPRDVSTPVDPEAEDPESGDDGAADDPASDDPAADDPASDDPSQPGQ